MSDRWTGAKRSTAGVIGSLVVVAGLILAACGSAPSRPEVSRSTTTNTPTNIESGVRPPATTTVTTTTDPATTTSTTQAATTTTTEPATTSTTQAATTTTTEPATTTSTKPVTTTTTPPATTTSTTSSSTWWWLALALVLAAVILTLIVLGVQRRNRNRAELTWQSESVGALDGARLARGLLPASGSEIIDATHWRSVRERVEQSAQSLDRAGAAAPSARDAGFARTTAEALRGLVFALEADRLLRDGAQAPSPEQLGQADATTRARTADLDTALDRLDGVVNPRPDGATSG
jgi:hypothetical protein